MFFFISFFNKLIRNNGDSGLRDLPSMVESFKDVVPEDQLLEMVGSVKDGQFTLRKYQNILATGQNQEVITPNSNLYL